MVGDGAGDATLPLVGADLAGRAALVADHPQQSGARPARPAPLRTDTGSRRSA
ncbi:phage DNA packaging protein J [Streptomyces sp. NPDC047014]|uniref:phage DNA packaging protein J n=1 Tax=Streptomyces sp. NPDC047014 TaxID=3155736 RepID=UPI003409734B